MAFGVYGKHPAKGDFVEYGVPPALLRVVEGWLDKALAEAREALGPQWEQVWPRAPHLCFWLGEAIWGQPVAGVLAPSRDRVGRRFPLVWLASGADVPPPPVAGADVSWWTALSVHAAAMLARSDLAQPAALLEGAPRPVGEGVAAFTAAEFWATRPGADVAALWADVAQADHRSAAGSRSFWWVAGDAVQAAPAPVDAAVFGLAETEAEAEDAPEPAPEELPAEVEDAATDSAGEEAAADPLSGPEEADAAGEPASGPAAGTEAPSREPAGEEDVWALVGVAEDDGGSPFDTPAGGLGLFAAPAPVPAAVAAEVAAAAETVTAAPPPSAPPPPAARHSQIWAGAGLPGGAVLAWFFRGHAGNG
jgi:type VI secretion system protein ImpM